MKVSAILKRIAMAPLLVILYPAALLWGWRMTKKGKQ